MIYLGCKTSPTMCLQGYCTLGTSEAIKRKYCMYVQQDCRKCAQNIVAAIKQRLECMNHKAGQRDTISLPTTTVPLECATLH